MKYANLDLGTVEAVFNKLGGLEGAQAFLRSDVKVMPVEKPAILVPRDSVLLKLAAKHEPASFYKDRKGLWVYDGFTSLVVSKAKLVDAPAQFSITVFDLGRDATDKEIEDALPKEHLFDESAVCAIIAELISKQEGGTSGTLEKTGYANLFYTCSCVVYVRWHSGSGKWYVNSWARVDIRWNAGNRAFSPETSSFSPPIYLGGVFVSRPFFQPPSILPTSTMRVDSCSYFLVSSACSSHAIRKKNLSVSVRLTARARVGSFSSFPW